MAKPYPKEFRDDVVAVARQDRIDRVLQPGLTTAEKTELGVANRKIAALEAELDAATRALERLEGVCPKRPVRGHPHNGR